MDDVTWETINRLVGWLDRGSSLPDETKTILQILKITEEAGEVAEALIGVTGQNPRKGYSHSWQDVQNELCDVVITAMVALTRINPDARDVFRRHLDGVAVRSLGAGADAGTGPDGDADGGVSTDGPA
jgi:NTP pyrophosphatase (non-canonical NTP hydrolase)